MNNTPAISVIVPVYNVEKYLPRCIESILNQTFTDFELLLVDDGSPDCCGKICDEYATKDNRIRVFHKTNEGVSSARNVGLNKAKGKWISFIDSDDWVDENLLDSLFNSAVNNPSDLVISGYIRVSSKCKKIMMYEKKTLKTNQISLDLIESELNKSVKFRMPWGRLFKKDIITSNGIIFNENLSLGEDFLFNLQYIMHISSVSIINETSYFYRETVCSLTKKFYPIEIRIYSCNVFKDILEKLALKYSNEKIFNYLFSKQLENILRYSYRFPIIKKDRLKSLNYYFENINEKLQQNISFPYSIVYSLRKTNLRYIDHLLMFIFYLVRIVRKFYK